MSASNYLRYSDNCLSQFKSRFTLEELLRIRLTWLALVSARFSYFEANEGKSSSDLGGALAKLALKTVTLAMGDASGLSGTRASIAQEVVRRIRAGLSYGDDGKVGNFAFFR